MSNKVSTNTSTANTTQSTTSTTQTKINWKVRLKNKVWLAAMASLIISFAYGLVDLLGIIPSLPESRTIEIVQSTLSLLAIVGVIVDPTTAGIGDSERALGYEQPWDDNADGDSDSDSDEDEIGLTD